MPAHWPRVKLGEVLHRSAARITIKPNTRYREVTVRLWGKGVIVRREVDGMEIAATDRFLCSADQFILSRIDARNGAFGLVPSELDGAIVTNDFPLFDVDAIRLDVRFLSWLSKTAGFVELCKAASEGTTNRVRLKEDVFLNTEIPLPPPDEQRRIVARVDAIADRIAAARQLREDVAEDQAAFVTSFHLTESSEEKALTEVLELDEERVPITPTGSYPQVGLNGFGGGLFAKEAVLGTGTTYKHFNRLFAGALVLSQVKGWEGAIAVCPQSLVGRFASPEYRTFRCRPGIAEPSYLAALVWTPWFWRHLASLTRGVGARRERVRPEMFLALRIPFPALAAQQRAVTMFQRFDALKALQAESAAELDALLPAVLAKAFAGEL